MATTQSIIDYYADLLTLQYLEKSKAYATIQALASYVIADQLPVEVENAFNISTAVGVQLDTLGKYAGVTRYGYEPDGTPIELSDSDFRQLIQIATLTNTQGSSLATIQNLLNEFFEDQIFVFDYKNMRLSYLIDEDIGSLDLVYMFLYLGLLPKPMGVQLAAVIAAPIIDAFFGMRTYLTPAANVSPFNDYGDYQTDYPWLSYSDAVFY